MATVHIYSSKFFVDCHYEIVITAEFSLTVFCQLRFRGKLELLYIYNYMYYIRSVFLGALIIN